MKMVTAYEVHCGLLFGMDSSRLASPVVLVVKNLPADAGDIRDAGSIPGLGRAPGGGHVNTLQYSCLENSMDRGAWQIHRIKESDTAKVT